MHRVLLIEDDLILQKMYQSKFQIMNYQILTASDGEEGVEKAKKALPDLILLDLMMPKLGGVNALKLLKQDITTRNIPVAILSVIPQDDVEDQGDKQILDNIVAYWRKDQNDPSEIVLKVQQFLEKGPDQTAAVEVAAS